MPRTWPIPESIQANAAAMLDDDQPDYGRVIVTWVEAGEPTDVQCDGWLDSGVLFVPFDGQSPIGSNFDEDGLPEGAWYEATSGHQAIVGLAVAPLATLS